jgi:L-amino acid N-acyltransferase YncA
MSAELPRSIREAAAEDWPRIWPIFAAVVAKGDTYTVSPEVSEADAFAYWMGKGLAVYVAEQGGTVVGTYALRANQPGLGAHVANAGYMVDPSRFGQGIGSLMCEHSLNQARARRFEAMQFNAVVSSNHRAVALWHRHGFAVIGTVPRGYKHRTLGYVDLYIMHRHL